MADSTKASARPVEEITAIDKLVLINTPQATVLAVESGQFDRAVFVRELSNIYDQIGRGNPASIERIVKKPNQAEARAWLAAAKSAIEEDLQKKDVTGGRTTIGTQLEGDMTELYRHSHAYFTRVGKATPEIDDLVKELKELSREVADIKDVTVATLSPINTKINTVITRLEQVKTNVSFQPTSEQKAKEIWERYRLSILPI